MSLYLTITSYHKITPGQCVEIIMDSTEIAIGRGHDNDWVLSDPERLVSLKHCVVRHIDGRYFVTDNSTNGIELVLAGIRLRRGNSEPIQDGETIRIGGYEISARISNGLPSDPKSFDMSSAQSFDALMASAKSPPQTANGTPAHLPVWSGDVQDTVSDLFDFLTPNNMPSEPRADHVPAVQHHFRPPSVSSTPPVPVAPDVVISERVIPADWDVFLSPTAPVVEPAQTDDAHFVPEPVQMEPARVASEPITPLSPDASPSDLLTAFLTGAGLQRLQLDDEQSHAQMEMIGRSYRRMVEGLIDILRARSSLKGEFRLQQTLIRPLENNPLKFAPNADEALLLMLRQGGQAFMTADQAIDDSFHDLRAHQLAVMAGVEASITTLLKRFEPACLQARMDKPGVLSRWIGSHPAQCWRRFTELYADISQEAEDDFAELFGREFGRAYEQHNARSRGC